MSTLRNSYKLFIEKLYQYNALKHRPQNWQWMCMLCGCQRCHFMHGLVEVCSLIQCILSVPNVQFYSLALQTTCAPCLQSKWACAFPSCRHRADRFLSPLPWQEQSKVGNIVSSPTSIKQLPKLKEWVNCSFPCFILGNHSAIWSLRKERRKRGP